MKNEKDQSNIITMDSEKENSNKNYSKKRDEHNEYNQFFNNEILQCHYVVSL